MEFQFSFGKKHELILVDKKPYIHHIGTLIQSVLDTDWCSLKRQIELWELGEIPSVCWESTMEQILKAADCHPVILLWLCDGAKQNALIKQRIDGLTELRERIRTLMEDLVDEDQYGYITRFYELFSDRSRWKGTARTTELDGSFTGTTVESVVYYELQYLCKNRFFIRKCACCRRFFWTYYTNKVYCNRPVPGRSRTCNQYGPGAKRQKKRRPAYNLYWEKRAEMFQLTTQEKDHLAFQAWVKAAQPYKEMAKQGNISLEDMAICLKRIERCILPSLP